MSHYVQNYRQIILRLPEKLAAKVNEGMKNNSLEECEFEPEKTDGSDNRWIFWLNSARYPARLANLPCLVESQKTHDKITYYKSNDIGQVLIVFMTEKEAENADLSSKIPGYEDVYPSGLTPPTTNIVKRRFAKTKRNRPFTREEVSRVEDIILKILDKHNDNMEYIFEEVVAFEDYMVSEDAPGGVTLGDDAQLLKEHPELLLSNFELTDELKLDDGSGTGLPVAAVAASNEGLKSRGKKKSAAAVTSSSRKAAPTKAAAADRPPPSPSPVRSPSPAAAAPPPPPPSTAEGTGGRVTPLLPSDEDGAVGSADAAPGEDSIMTSMEDLLGGGDEALFNFDQVMACHLTLPPSQSPFLPSNVQPQQAPPFF